MTATLAAADFLRTPTIGMANAEAFKEWHHFVIHAGGCRLLVNFSLNTESAPDGRYRLAPRVIVIAHDDRWGGAVERFAADALAIAPSLGELTIGGNRMLIRPDGYRVVIDLPARGIAGELSFVPASKPFVVTNQPVGSGRMSWLFVPRLHATGWLRIGGREHRFTDDIAYHDHNWGRFRWGDDFGWEWATVLPSDPDQPWSLVFLRMTDRRRLRYFSQALYVWHHNEPAAIFRHAAVAVRTSGVLHRRADCTLPAPMRLLLDGEVPGVPECVTVTAHRAGDAARVEFLPQSYARLAQPSELSLDGVTVLCESTGAAVVTGSINGRRMDFRGTGVFEFLHG
ncbi:hypothetical protein [Mycolicibacterium diernhoferi]|uniref:AttH domain-containing protein n=1 Tax=Mycolicibacterium diernhoferi TaxID=1801 RepID=A0A1Q4HES4_9MYCO|nr:hypothetical protein [Mycolicibacterium diernhoferi]OJZ66044.1 hypothetical protein BRW64_11625 [Mycolicibacterium diernhoferi]OPE55324.1 hypothetical protein BV510_05600 [Mycolicibacterium diernhoferi]PEG54593.1 hypothetical protein CRI78_10415 [Mycolicibacterium diernhoferi]QYL23951.1 hypothetical protein K0O62_06570 [Mycolicibacterium diernhoferi]